MKSKSEWAREQADRAERSARQISDEAARSGNWRRRASARDGVAHLYAEAARYRRMAERYAQQGI